MTEENGDIIEFCNLGLLSVLILFGYIIICHPRNSGRNMIYIVPIVPYLIEIAEILKFIFLDVSGHAA